MTGFKKVNNADPGIASKHGGNDIDDIAEILNGLTVPGKTAPIGKQIIPLSVTIADYIQSITSAIVLSGTPTTVLQNTGTLVTALYSGSFIRRAQEFKAGAAELSNTLTEVSFWLQKVGSPTGTATFNVRDASDVIVNTFGTLDVSTLTTSFTKQTANNGERTLRAGDRVTIEYSGGDASNRIEVHVALDVYDGTNSIHASYISSWSELPGNDTRFEMKFLPGGNTIDDDTGTKWTSASEINPQIIFDIGSLQLIPSIAIYRDALDTTTEITIELSPDDVTYTLLRTIDTTFITTGQYTYILFNRSSELMQYIRIIGTDGTAKVMSIAEIKVRSVTRELFNDLHEHKTISTTDLLLQPNGDP